jgi:thiamine biosynthesis protein ThiI
LRAVCLVSGGIDSPVAAYMMLNREVEVALLHMDNASPTNEKEIGKVEEVRHRLEASVGMRVPLFVSPHARNQELIAASCRKGLQCVLCKRLMLRVAKRLALRIGGDVIITGDSLGQVASQTLHNLAAESHGLDFPVLRPLIGLDKAEIEALAKRIGTYEISIGKATECRWVPARPVTMAKAWRVAEEECRIDIEEMSTYSAERAVELRDPRT